MYLVGVDVGTTNIKAIIFDAETGQVCAVGSCRNAAHHPVPEWSEYDAGDLWAKVLHSIQQAVQQCPDPQRIQAIAVASMGEAAFPIDERGTVVYPAIAWYDQRSLAQATWWEKTFGQERVFAITGHTPAPMFGVNKLLWLREHEPHVFARIRHWLSIEDFVVWKLSGTIATDYSIASRTMLFDQQALNWSQTLLQHANLPGDWFPPVFPSGTAIGSLLASVAEQTGLPRQTLVCTGGHDHLCAALATGTTRAGHLLESMGTASVVLAVSDAFAHNTPLLDAGCTSYAYVVEHTYVTLGTLSFAGGALEWMVTLLYGQGREKEASSQLYEQALNDAAHVPPGAGGVTLLPAFLGSGTPYQRNAKYGAIFGLTPAHTRMELMRALIESLAFWLRDNTDLLVRLGIVPPPTEITVVGGTTQAHLLLQLKADILGFPVKVPQIPEAAATGAALLAGMGVQLFSSAREAASSVKHTVQVYTPDPQAVETYRDIYNNTYLPIRHLSI